MRSDDRDDFDRLLQEVLDSLPDLARRCLDEVPLVVEDHPSKKLMRELGLTQPDELCGLYDGIPLTEPEQRTDRALPDVVLIFREGILSAAADDQGQIDDDELRRQIRITILHEIGHHHGLDEEDLRQLGYD